MLEKVFSVSLRFQLAYQLIHIGKVDTWKQTNEPNNHTLDAMKVLYDFERVYLCAWVLNKNNLCVW